MITPGEVGLSIVTRGDVDLIPILEPYNPVGLADARLWNSRLDEELIVYGRYAAIAEIQTPVIISQDDDVILPSSTIQSLLDAYEPGKIVCNVPERFRLRYKDSGMIGFGAIFDRDLPDVAFARFHDANRNSAHYSTNGRARFFRLCDIVFTMLTPVVKLDLPYTELPYARDESRMWRQPGHFEECDAMRKLCREVRDAAA